MRIEVKMNEEGQYVARSASTGRVYVLTLGNRVEVFNVVGDFVEAFDVRPDKKFLGPGDFKWWIQGYEDQMPDTSSSARAGHCMSSEPYLRRLESGSTHLAWVVFGIVVVAVALALRWLIWGSL